MHEYLHPSEVVKPYSICNKILFYSWDPREFPIPSLFRAGKPRCSLRFGLWRDGERWLCSSCLVELVPELPVRPGKAKQQWSWHMVYLFEGSYDLASQFTDLVNYCESDYQATFSGHEFLCIRRSVLCLFLGGGGLYWALREHCWNLDGWNETIETN